MILQTPVADDVRLALMAALTDHGFGDVTVAENVPEPMPDFFVRLESGSASGVSDVILASTSIDLQVWGPLTGRDRAEKLSRYVAAIISDLEGTYAGDTFIYEVVSTAPHHFPDAESRRPRWVFSVQIVSRALVI